MNGLLLAAVVASGAWQGGDTLPVVTLGEALERSARVDPAYIAAVGQMEQAEWARRAARLVFVLPTLSATADYSEFTTSQFNVGLGSQASASSSMGLSARYELFTGGRKLNTARQADAELESSRAGEVGARFLLALQTERDYYDVLGARELLAVATERLERARQQFALARTRVQSGATVQSDSLQTLLEVRRSEAEVLAREAALTVARLQLGQRIGVVGGVDAAPVDTLVPAELPVPLAQAIRLASRQGPAWLQARARERSAEAALRARQGSYLPTIALTGAYSLSDVKFVPEARRRGSVGISLSWALWDGGQREVAVSGLRIARDVARAVREDLERGATRDITEAHLGYDVARRTLILQESAADVAAEVLRVQESRYRAGASSILELLDAQARLSEAQADRVRARYDVRLARSGLEAMLGTRLSPELNREDP